MSVAIIDYGSGNLHSAAKAFERAARGMENPAKIVVTRDPETAVSYTHLDVYKRQIIREVVAARAVL